MVLFEPKSKVKALKQEVKLNYLKSQEKITINQLRGFLVLSNGFRIKAIDARKTLEIKEHFAIDKWAKLKDSITPEQLEELWLISNHDSDFVLATEELKLFVF